MDPVIVIPFARLKAILEDMVDTGTDYEDAEIRLFQNDIFPDENSLLADFTACTYTGYLLHTITSWTDAFVDEDGLLKVETDSALFQGSGSAVGNTIYGYYLTTTAGAAFLGAARFATPKVINEADQGFTLQAAIAWPVAQG